MRIWIFDALKKLLVCCINRMKKAKFPVIDIKKYGGKQVVIVQGRIVTSGRTTREVLERAKKKIPRRLHGEIWVFAVPQSLTVVYRYS